MKTYHKIQTVFKRDPENRFKTLLEGEFAKPEFEYLKDNEWIFTEKVDGTNIRVMFDGYKITFGGKTDRAQIPADLSNRLNDIFLPQIEIFQNLFVTNPDKTTNAEVCLYGEGYGAKIQKGGGNYRQDQDFVLFDIKIGEFWLQRDDIETIAKELKLDIVPILATGNIDKMVRLTRQGFNSQWGCFKAEGIVARPKIEFTTRNRSRIITKLKHKDFKL
jgi:hypothetical protein